MRILVINFSVHRPNSIDVPRLRRQAQLLRELARPRSLTSTACEGLYSNSSRQGQLRHHDKAYNRRTAWKALTGTFIQSQVNGRLVLRMHPCKTQLLIY